MDSFGLSTPARRILGTIFALPRTAQAVLSGKHGWWCKVGPGKGAEVDPGELGALASRAGHVPASSPVPAWLVLEKEVRGKKRLLPFCAQGLPLDSASGPSASSDLCWASGLGLPHSFRRSGNHSHFCPFSHRVRVCVCTLGSPRHSFTKLSGPQMVQTTGRGL